MFILLYIFKQDVSLFHSFQMFDLNLRHWKYVRYIYADFMLQDMSSVTDDTLDGYYLHG